MSPSGRYQSRLFSFFSHQSLRLKDRTSQAWRQVKLAAVWGAQIALYPIYAVFQTGRLLGRQMGRARFFPWLQAAKQQILYPSEALLAADAPIQNVLGMGLAMKGLEGGLPPMLASNPLNPPILGDFEALKVSVQVRGIAIELATRSLVLVTAENEILDVLTGEQQLQLQRQMVWEMADFWRQRKSQELSGGNGLAIEGSRINTFLPLPKEKAHLLPPVRAFRQLMAWVQLSPVAIAANLFQESRLVLPAAFEPVSDDHLLPSAQEFQTEVDQQVDRLFSASEPLSLLAWVKNQAIGITDASKSLGRFLQNSSLVLYDPLPRSEPDFATDFATEPPLIPADFSQSTQKLHQKPWLSIEDFFTGEFLGVTGTGQLVKRSDESIVSPDRPEDVNPVGDLVSSAAVPIAQPEADEKASETPLLEAETWEVEVTSVSYETHPLEQLLKWLDLGMLWIEQKLADVWKWVKR
jgi:hypothetical protein